MCTVNITPPPKVTFSLDGIGFRHHFCYLYDILSNILLFTIFSSAYKYFQKAIYFMLVVESLVFGQGARRPNPIFLKADFGERENVLSGVQDGTSLLI